MQKSSQVLAILCGAPFLAGLDLFVVNVAFADIGRSFPGHSLGDLSWILNGYAIVYAALLIPIGRWADRIGNRRAFVGGLIVFTAASAACALAPSVAALVGFRVVQAIGAAALTPTSMGLLLHAVPAERRAFSVRIWAATNALAAAIGPVVGGLLVELSWRWIFLINVPMGVVLVFAALRAVPDYRVPDPDTDLDLVGAAVLTVGIGALSLALVEGNDWGWGSTGVLVSFAVAAVALTGFAVNTARHPSPLIDLALFRVRTYAWANLAIWLFSAAFAAGLLGGILFLQEVWGYSAVKTGLAVAPGPLMVPVFALGGAALIRRVPAGWLAAIGCALWAAGSVLMLTSVGPTPAYFTELLPGWLLGGVGVGLTLPTILATATASLPPARSATGSAIVNMSRQVGTVIGVSVLVAVLGSPVGWAQAHAAFQRTWWVIAAIALVSAGAALGLSTARRTPAVSPSVVAAETR
ncbi:MFS transporter [Cryptosporangium phraense]|uniref:MFS transporter n=1 Tax=Cryptosporangium phraense TaxID=2593070 RepID=A0A545AN22_9ACTN|nr:MFS transporter [Cryptosporangium phraense]TQS42670.1 MFS transporter [Cryptosporangium phraense]